MLWIKDTKFWAGCLVGFIVGVLLLSFLGAKKTSNDSSIATTTLDFVTSVDQKAGDSVYVLKVYANGSTWVAVRENNNDVIGRILGAQRVPDGLSENVLVELLKPTLPQVMYAVVLYKDDGDSKFDQKIDELVTNGGEPLLSQFIAK